MRGLDPPIQLYRLLEPRKTRRCFSIFYDVLSFLLNLAFDVERVCQIMEYLLNGIADQHARRLIDF